MFWYLENENNEIGYIEVFNNISVSPFNFANMPSKYISNLVASGVAIKRWANTV